MKILFVGNSITRHSPAPQIGWNYDWGMAASSLDNDYVHILMRRVRGIIPDADFLIGGGAVWERDYWNDEARSQAYSESVAYKPDIIIMRIVENVPADKQKEYDFEEAYTKLLEYLNPEHKAKIIVTTGFWRAGERDECIRRSAEKLGYPLCDLNSLDTDENKAIGLFEHNGVAAHPGDKGMLAIADEIWKLLEGMVREAAE